MKNMSYCVKVVDYFDVLGNEEDGFEVNNLCQWKDDFSVSEDVFDSGRTILSWLRSVGYLKRGKGLNVLAVCDYYPFYEIESRRTGEPICRIDVIEEVFNEAHL